MSELSFEDLCSDFFWTELHEEKKQTKNQHNLENTLLSNESLTGPPPQPGSAHSCVCYMQALCWCASEVLEKGRRHLEEGLQAASPFTAGKRTWIAEGPRPERGQNWGGRVSGQSWNRTWIITEGRESSGTVSHDDEGGQELTKLRGGDGPTFRLAASLPALGQLGVGRRREVHRRARSGNKKLDFLLLLLLFHAILFSQLPVHSHGLICKNCKIPGTAGPDEEKGKRD